MKHRKGLSKGTSPLAQARLHFFFLIKLFLPPRALITLTNELPFLLLH